LEAPKAGVETAPKAEVLAPAPNVGWVVRLLTKGDELTAAPNPPAEGVVEPKAGAVCG